MSRPGSNQYVMHGNAPTPRQATASVGAAVAVDDALEEAAFAFHPDRDLWAKAGFESGAVASQWVLCGFSVEQATEWRAEAAMSARTARRWRDAGFDPKKAGAADRHGFDDPIEVHRWGRLGYGVVTAERWRNEGFSCDMAKQWAGQGRLKLRPVEARAWLSAGFSDHPFIAASLHHAGVSPEHGVRRLAYGMDYREIIAEVKFPADSAAPPGALLW